MILIFFLFTFIFTVVFIFLLGEINDLTDFYLRIAIIFLVMLLTIAFLSYVEAINGY